MSNKNRYRSEILHMIWDQHFTAQDLHSKLKKVYPFVGLWTVYRNLTELVEDNELMKTSWLIDHTIYEKHKKPHWHIVCKTSKQVFDVDVSMIDISWLDLPHQFSIHEINISFHWYYEWAKDACKWNIKNK